MLALAPARSGSSRGSSGPSSDPEPGLLPLQLFAPWLGRGPESEEEESQAGEAWGSQQGGVLGGTSSRQWQMVGGVGGKVWGRKGSGSSPSPL